MSERSGRLIDFQKMTQWRKRKKIFLKIINLLKYPANKGDIPIIRLAICGSVDDGKSTLVGHLMHLKKLIYDDEYSRLKSSKIKLLQI